MLFFWIGSSLAPTVARIAASIGSKSNLESLSFCKKAAETKAELFHISEIVQTFGSREAGETLVPVGSCLEGITRADGSSMIGEAIDTACACAVASVAGAASAGAIAGASATFFFERE